MNKQSEISSASPRYKDKTRQLRFEQGLCVSCGQNSPESQKKQCSSCLENHNKNATLRRFRLKEKSICTVCEINPSEPDKAKCLSCSKRASDHIKQVRQKLKEAGICATCRSNPIESGQTNCLSCQESRKITDKQRLEKYRKQKVCVKCGNPPLPAMLKSRQHIVCETCYLKQTGSRHKIDWESLRDKLIEQDYKCIYTGEILILGKNDSVDHIFPQSTYPDLKQDPNNIQWVTREVNKMKNNRTHEEFIAFCKLVADYSSHTISVRIAAPRCLGDLDRPS